MNGAEQAVNQSFVLLLSGYSWRVSQEPAVVATYGAEALALAKEVYSYALDYKVDWQQVTLTEAIVSVRNALQEAYPFLNRASIYQLGDCFAYAWK